MNDFSHSSTTPGASNGAHPGIAGASGPPQEESAPAISSRAALPATPVASNSASGPGRRPEGPGRAEPRTIIPPATPVLSYALTLNSDFAQRVYRRTWERLKPDLFVLTVRTRRSRQHEAAKAIENIITDAFSKTRRDLSADLERTEVLIDHVKLTDFPQYKQALSTQATYSTPRAKEFLLLLQQMDQLLIRYDALWLNGHIETHIREDRSHNWSRRLIKICNRLRQLAQTTRTKLARSPEQTTADSRPDSTRSATDSSRLDEAHALVPGTLELPEVDAGAEEAEFEEFSSSEPAVADELHGDAALDAAFAADARAELTEEPGHPAHSADETAVGTQVSDGPHPIIEPSGSTEADSREGRTAHLGDGEGGAQGTSRRHRRSPTAPSG
jgi:hypothetical protein